MLKKIDKMVKNENSNNNINNSALLRGFSIHNVRLEKGNQSTEQRKRGTLDTAKKS